MSNNTILDLKGVWDSATQISQENKVDFTEVLCALPASQPLEAKVYVLARALVMAKSQSDSVTIKNLAQRVHQWKHFSSLDWRTRSNIRIVLACVEGKSTWMITAWECLKSFIWTISFTSTSQKALKDMLEVEFKIRPIAQKLMERYKIALIVFMDPSVPVTQKLKLMKQCIKAGMGEHSKEEESQIEKIEVALAKALRTHAAGCIPHSSLAKYVSDVDALAPSAPLWFPKVYQELGLGHDAAAT